MRTVKWVGALVAGLAMVVGLAGFAAPAVADDQPTTQQLLQQCEQRKTDYCEFHPEGSPVVYRAGYRLAGGATNCGSAKQTGSSGGSRARAPRTRSA